jgi:hypothetical protein
VLYPERTVVTGINLLLDLFFFFCQILCESWEPSSFYWWAWRAVSVPHRSPQVGAKKKKRKKAATSTEKVPVPDVIPVVDTFNSNAENSGNFDNSVGSRLVSRSGNAMQQQVWGWLASNLTAIMNQLKGNVRNDSAKRAKFENIQDNLVLNG